jgi:hypothetical protein
VNTQGKGNNSSQALTFSEFMRKERQTRIYVMLLFVLDQCFSKSYREGNLSEESE